MNQINPVQKMTRPRQKFSVADLHKLKRCAEAGTDKLARLRCRAVYQYGLGHPVDKITGQLGCSRTILMDWCRSFRQSGIEGLLDHRRGGNRARLAKAQLMDLKQRLRHDTGNKPGWTVEQLAQLVKNQYGVQYKSRFVVPQPVQKMRSGI